MLSIGLVISLMFSFVYSAPTPTEKYSNQMILKDPDLFILYWNYNENDITLETHAKTNGWSAIGLSPTGGMHGSDVVVSWINSNGSYHFTDRHIEDKQVLVDKTQNWFPLSVSSKDGYLITKFTRKIKICDTTNEDIDIPPGTPFVIFAYSDKFSNGEITYHDSNRGTRTIPLISSLNTIANINMSEVETFDYRANVFFFY